MNSKWKPNFFHFIKMCAQFVGIGKPGWYSCTLAELEMFSLWQLQSNSGHISSCSQNHQNSDHSGHDQNVMMMRGRSWRIYIVAVNKDGVVSLPGVAHRVPQVRNIHVVKPEARKSLLPQSRNPSARPCRGNPRTLMGDIPLNLLSPTVK